MSFPYGPAAGLDESVHPRLQEPGSREPGQPADGVVDLPGRRPPIDAAEQVSGEEDQLLARLHSAPHRRPESIHEQPGDPRGGGPGKPALSLAVVEEKVA